jgi:hypothetical protein
VKVNNVADCIIEEVEASSFINIVMGFGDVEEIKDRSQNLVHSLDILYFRV